MQIETMRWDKGRLELVDQRLLPAKLKYVLCRTVRDVWKAIKELQVRGAPAIGIAGAYGVYLGIKDSGATGYRSFKRDLDRTVEYLAGSRPTARNLFWALERMSDVLERNNDKPVEVLKNMMLKEAHAILAEDKKICRAIGQNGAKLIPSNASLLTHCNAGGLATADYGTALGVIFAAERKLKKVYVDETRPVLQGSRLTAWELTERGIPAVLICDNMAAHLMAKGSIDAVVVGADRIAANGDTANKIGTYGLAISAAYHNIPFYVAAPSSTFDLSVSDGSGIPIEERAADEVRKIGGVCIAPKNIPVKNPAFDVTPAKLITAIITEKGVIRPPWKRNIKKTLK